ncbi:MAG: hypothetical protein Q9160_000571 [Pyrenula sp. 1 TL-2023]
MEPWLDSLSEDWNSDHQSSSLSLPHGSPNDLLPSSLQGSHSRSRIPRIPSAHAQGSVRDNYLRPRSRKGLARSKTSPVLGEQSSSQLNVAAHLTEYQSKNSLHAKNKNNDTHSRNDVVSLPRRMSAAFSDSQQSVQHHTIHESAKGRNKGDTLEWKRRLANDGRHGVFGGDLFGPTKLEGIFQQPSNATAQVEPAIFESSGTSRPWTLPSSSSEAASGNTQAHQSMRASKTRMSEMEILHEENEDESNNLGLNERQDTLSEHYESNRFNAEGEAVGSRGSHYNEDYLSNLPGTRLRRSLSESHEDDPRLRTLSGMEEIRNEEISPINVSRTNTLSFEARMASFRPPRSTPRQPKMVDTQRSPSPLSDSALQLGGSSLVGRVNRNELLGDLTSNSLPDDLSMGTQDFVAKGGFVNTRRGGYSNDNSFLKRNLSSSSMPDRINLGLTPSTPPLKSSPPTNMDPHDTESLSTPVPVKRPNTPISDDDGLPSTPSPVKGSGSPLKLFGNYDTFTSKRLLTRIGQFEVDSANNDGKEEKAGKNPRATQTSPSEESNSLQSFDQLRMSQFGKGELDQFAFNQQASRVSSRLMSQPSAENYDEDKIFDFSPEGTPEGALSNSNDRYKPTSLPKVRKRISQTTDANLHVKITQVEQSDQILTQVETREQKRTLRSPGKERTPKRRRTLMRDEVDLTQQVPEAKDPNDPVQVAGRKRKDARYDNNGPIADPEVLAMRQMLRPKTAQRRTSSQKPTNESGNDSYMDLLEENGDWSIEVQEDLVSAVTHEVASAGADITRMANEARKGSVTTQDFLNEATKIMNLIRQKGKDKAALEILREPENGSEGELEPDDFADSTKENFSRPPSREGVGRVRRQGYQAPQDPRVVSHLRRYAEDDDPAAALNSSMVSLKLSDSHSRPESPVAPKPFEEELQMSPANIRIRESIDQQRKRKHSASTAEDGQSTRRNTQSSYGNSTGQSVPTTSTKSSGQKGIISPGKVEIPNQLGPMVYDPSTKTWKKNNTSDSSRNKKEPEAASDEDPFEDIPDLSIDEIREKARTMRFPDSCQTEPQLNVQVGSVGHSAHADLKENTQRQAEDNREAVYPRNNSASTRPAHTNRVIAEEGVKKTSFAIPQNPPMPEAESSRDRVSLQKLSEEAEHEIRIHEGRASQAPEGKDVKSKQPRVVTITFSSPLVSGVVYQDDHSISDTTSRTSDRASSNEAAFFSEATEATKLPQERSSKWRPSNRNISAPLAPRQRSGVNFVGRPVSRIDEQDEDSVLGEMSLIHVADATGAVTPLPQRTQGAMMAPPTGGKGSSLICLTPLSDFTLHQVDDPIHLELSYVAERAHPTSLQQAHGQLSLAVDEMVKAITDVEPFEPYWGQLRRLSLADKSLTSLHRLRDYCSELEELDISHNKVGQLSGLPTSLRLLKVPGNCLTNLTSWGSLHNLQYLDISNNKLESLEGFSGLVHLRELKANNNRIRNIDGVFDLNGLLSLKLKGNEIASVNFEGAELSRLQDLDLSENALFSLNGIQYLPNLETLDIGDNHIEDLSFGQMVKIPKLRSLRLSNNRLRTFNIAPFPFLELLYLDKNKIVSLHSFSTAHSLQTLSLREQSESPDILNLAFSTVPECRKLYLSSNVCPHEGLRRPPLPLLNLQYLEVASCGLSTLPDGFGVMVPNCRVINLNFNAVKSISSLKGIQRLNKVLLAGNRIAKMRETIAMLAKFTALTKIDLRNNPLTIGFYAPVNSREHRLVVQDSENALHEQDLVDPFTLPDADRVIDEKWATRLDETTKVKRRIMALLLAERCGKLLWVDGLEWIRQDVLRVDTIALKLKELGILKDEVSGRAQSIEDWVSEHG